MNHWTEEKQCCIWVLRGDPFPLFFMLCKMVFPSKRLGWGWGVELTSLMALGCQLLCSAAVHATAGDTVGVGVLQELFQGTRQQLRLRGAHARVPQLTTLQNSSESGWPSLRYNPGTRNNMCVESTCLEH